MTPWNYLSRHNLNSHNLNSHNLKSHILNSPDLNCHNLNCHDLNSNDLKSYDLNCHNLNSLMRVNKSAFIRWRDCHCHIPFPQWLTWVLAPTRWSATPSPTSSASATASGTWNVRLQLFRPGGSQPFLTRVPPNQNEPSSRTPKSKLTSSRTPKTSFNSLLLGLFWYELYFRVPPMNCLRTPRGTRTPGWEPLI